MLHPVPNSTARSRLLAVVEMQRHLLAKLCSLAPSSVVDLAWLKKVWINSPDSWVQRFWENDKGNRKKWINAIAGASVAEKQRISDLVIEQLRFAGLYSTPPTVRLTRMAFDTAVLDSLNKLLKAFYDPYFYKEEGLPDNAGTIFNKDDFISGFTPQVLICPYSDNIIGDTKLDHFLPKDQFPMLSCHPDNLMPCSTDSNSGGRKGTEAPLDLDESEQAASWFHPRWRSACGTYKLGFSTGVGSQKRVVFEALDPRDQKRLDNMERMFGLSEFWGRFLDAEVQLVAGDVAEELKCNSISPSDDSVRTCLLRICNRQRNRIGKDGLAIVKSFFYEHIANTPLLRQQILRTCVDRT